MIFTNLGNMSILNQCCYFLPCISYLTLGTYVLILDGLYLIVTIRDGLLQLCYLLLMFSLYPNDGLLINFLCPLCKLLSNMRIQHNVAVSSEVFCFWLLTGKQEVIHPLLIDVLMVLLQILGLVYRCTYCMYTTHLILISKVFLATILFDGVSRF